MRDRAAGLVLLSLLALPAHADVHPNTAPGFPGDQSFHVGDIDNVNLFNGALTLTIPLGGSYPVNAGFSYGLKLVYNANPWEFITTTIVFPGGTEATQRFAFPNGCSNAGLGFRVSLVTVPLLTSLTLPDGSSYHNMVNDYVIAPPSNGLCTEHAGNLTGLVLPTEGRLEWTWQTYRFNQSSTSKPYLQRSSGVATRTMRDSNGTVLGVWSYDTAITPNLSSQEQTTTVTDPLGHRTVSFFSTSMTPSFTGWSKLDYSLPFTRAQTLNVAPGVDLNLSRQVFNATA